MSDECKYPDCKNIQRKEPNIHVTSDIQKAIGLDFRVLPIYEKSLYEYTYRNHYSLQSHELLRCRWLAFKEVYFSRTRQPVQFPNIRDYHFYNCKNRFKPSESIFAKNEYRKKMRAGPGVDYRGQQIPIPSESIMKRGMIEKKK